jgi:hypothetical protein
MPRVPVPAFGADVSQRPLPTPYADPSGATPDTFGANVGAAVQGAASTADAIFREEKQKADSARVVQAEAQLGDSYNAAIFDPKQGFVTRRGTDALAAYKDTVDSLKKRRAEILASLSNDDQKRAFDARTTSTYEQAVRQIDNHTLQQSEQAATDAFKARETTSYATLANVAFDPVARGAEMDKMRGAIVERARTTGGEAVTTRAMLQLYDQMAHGVVLDQMLAKQQAAAAKTYFDQVRPELGTKADDYEKRIREVGVAQKGEAYAQEMIATSKLPGSVVVDEGAILTKVAKLNEPVEVKDATLQRALHYANVVKQAQDEKNSQVFARALSDIDQTGIVNPNDLAYLKNPANAGGKYLDTLLQMQRRNQEQAINAPPSVAQEAAFGRAQLAIGADQREFWATQNYDQMAGTFAGQVTRAQLGQLAHDLDVTHKWAQEENRVDRNQAIQMQVKDRLVKNAAFNKDPMKWTDDQWAVYSRALTLVKNQQRAFMVNNPDTQPTPDDVKKWIDWPLAKVKVVHSGILWDDKPVRAAANVLPQYQGKVVTYIIPSNEMDLIDAELKRVNLPVNNYYRQQLYLKRHGFYDAMNPPTVKKRRGR